MLMQQAPQPLGNDRFVRFFKHDEGIGFRGAVGFRDGCLMFLGIPLDLRNTQNIRAAVNTFGNFQHWVSDDPYLVRTIVFASFPEDILVPRDVVFSDYAAWGGLRSRGRPLCTFWVRIGLNRCHRMKTRCLSMVIHTRFLVI